MTLSAAHEYRRLNLTGLVAVALAVGGGYFAIKSLALAVHLERSLPYFDQWVWIVNDYFPYIDGKYSWTDLFALHGEHRIATTRVVLFADAILFNMQGWLPLITQYGLLALIGTVLARLAIENGRDRFAFSVLGVALMWSICQFDNLSWALQVCFPFVHLFAVLTTVTFARSLDGNHQWRWLSAACLCDFLAVNSLASGLLTLAPIIVVAALTRKLDRRLLIIGAFHVALTAWYFSSRKKFIGTHSGVPTDAIDRIAHFLGMSFGASQGTEIVAGYVGLAVFAIAAGVAVYRAFNRQIDTGSAVLFSIALFVVAEAVITAFGRAKLGIGPRYSTATLVFQCALLGFFLRESRRLIAVVLAATCILIAANSAEWEAAWRNKIAAIDSAANEFSRGEYNEGAVSFVWPGLRTEWLGRYLLLHPISSTRASAPAP